MDYKMILCCGLNDSNKVTKPLNAELPSDYFPNGFIPRVHDTIVYNEDYWDVRAVIFDKAFKEIRIWVKDSIVFN